MVLGFVAGCSVLAVVWVGKPARPESIGMTAGALLCFAVAVSSLGRLLHWNGELFLPFVTASLAYVAAGRIWQITLIKRSTKDK